MAYVNSRHLTLVPRKIHGIWIQELDLSFSLGLYINFFL